MSGWTAVGDEPRDDDARIVEAFDRGLRLKGEQPLELYFLEPPADWTVECAGRAALAAATIGLSLKQEPRLLWFRPAADVMPSQTTRAELKGFGLTVFEHPATLGLANPRDHAVAVDATLAAGDAIETVAHECFHLSARREKDDEQAAGAYGRKVAEAFEHVTYAAPPQMHDLSGAPGRAVGLAAPADTGDLLRATGGAYVNVGGRWSTRWRPVAPVGFVAL